MYILSLIFSRIGLNYTSNSPHNSLLSFKLYLYSYCIPYYLKSIIPSYKITVAHVFITFIVLLAHCAERVESEKIMLHTFKRIKYRHQLCEQAKERRALATLE